MKKLYIVLALILGFQYNSWGNPSNSISVPNPAVANTLIDSGSYNANNNEIQTKFNSHTHTDISQLGTITTGVWAATPITYPFLNLTGQILYADLAASTVSSINSANAYNVPSGGIIMWHGSIATIPSGWYLCDGNNGTPDLRNRFIVAADADVGGVAKSTITGSALQTSDTGVMPAHTHTVTGRTGNDAVGGAYTVAKTTDVDTTMTTSSAGTGTKVISVFYALAYIMKS